MKKMLPILFLILVSTFVIFYRFTDIPKNLSFDEVEFAKLALSLDNKPYAPYSPLATGHSTLYFYILLASLKTFGVSIFALRIPAAVFGVLSVLMFYLVIKKCFQQYNNIKMKQFPLLLSLILLTSHWFLNFSRFSFEVTFLLFLELTSIYFLLRFIDTSKYLYFVLCGLFAGLAFISYTPGRIFFALPFVFIILNWYRRGMPRLYKNIITDLLLFIIPFIIVITPLTAYLSTHIDTRIDQQFFLNNHEMPVNEKIAGLWHNISTTALMFNIKGDVNGRHNYPNKPALNPILGLLFIIGLIVSVKDFKNIFNKLFLFYFIISLFPALMTYPWENPNMLRTFTVLPSIIYFSGNALIYIYKKIPKYLILNTLYLLVLISCFYELRTYFKYQPTVFKQAFEIKLPLDKAIKIKN